MVSTVMYYIVMILSGRHNSFFKKIWIKIVLKNMGDALLFNTEEFSILTSFLSVFLPKRCNVSFSSLPFTFISLCASQPILKYLQQNSWFCLVCGMLFPLKSRPDILSMKPRHLSSKNLHGLYDTHFTVNTDDSF